MKLSPIVLKHQSPEAKLSLPEEPSQSKNDGSRAAETKDREHDIALKGSLRDVLGRADVSSRSKIDSAFNTDTKASTPQRLNALLASTGYSYPTEEKPKPFTNVDPNKGTVWSRYVGKIESNMTNKEIYNAIIDSDKYFDNWAHSNIKYDKKPRDEGDTFTLNHKGFPAQHIPNPEVKGTIELADGHSAFLIHETYPKPYERENHRQLFTIYENKSGDRFLIYDGILDTKKVDSKAKRPIAKLCLEADMRLRHKPAVKEILNHINAKK